MGHDADWGVTGHDADWGVTGPNDLPHSVSVGQHACAHEITDLGTDGVRGGRRAVSGTTRLLHGWTARPYGFAR